MKEPSFSKIQEFAYIGGGINSDTMTNSNTFIQVGVSFLRLSV